VHVPAWSATVALRLDVEDIRASMAAVRERIDNPE
jgi:hypothetical protein